MFGASLVFYWTRKHRLSKVVVDASDDISKEELDFK